MQVTVDLEATSCAVCGTTFAVEATLHKRLREKHQGFYCPNGHPLEYKGQSEVEKLRAEVKQLRDAEEYRQRRIEARTAKAQATRQRKRELRVVS